MANPYETLGVATNASQDDIRKAYRKAAKETHPDLNPGKPEAEKRFKTQTMQHCELRFNTAATTTSLEIPAYIPRS
jgi:DnaJ-class molecular chaperone